MEMLRKYGPDVPEGTLRKLVQAFGELRDMADQGLIAYPYSTREVVNMVKHLQKYPDEGLTSIVRNVFDFDSYNTEIQENVDARDSCFSNLNLCILVSTGPFTNTSLISIGNANNDVCFRLP
jgi:hypothetical protein